MRTLYVNKNERRRELRRKFKELNPNYVKEQTRRYNQKQAERPGAQERKREYNKMYYTAHKEEMNAATDKYRRDNPEKIKTIRDAYRKKRPPEYFRALSRKSYAKLRDSISAHRRVLRQSGYYSRMRLIRRARLKNAPGKTCQALLLEKLMYYGFRCRYCRVELVKGNLTFDHAIPVSRKGSNWTANLLPCCYDCNRRKGRKTFFEFINQMA